MELKNYNNIGIASIAIHATLNELDSLSLSKAVLIYPFFSSDSLTRFLARKNSNVKSIEQLIAEKTLLFANFNKRYYDTLPHSINAIQLLIETNDINLLDNNLSRNNDFIYTNKMGNRANRIVKGVKKLSIILNDETENLYSNLRIEL